jgi:hypothetical protein
LVVGLVRVRKDAGQAHVEAPVPHGSTNLPQPSSAMLLLMKPLVYIETSVVSYLTSRRSRDLVTAAHQELTRQWWDERSPHFELVISELVAQEASRGDAAASSGRMVSTTC